MKNRFMDEYIEENGFLTFNKKLCAILFAMVVTVVFITGCALKKTAEEDEVTLNPELQNEMQKDSINFGDDGINGAIAPDDTDDVTVVSSQPNELSQSMVSISLDDIGRSDPFLPENEKGNFTALSSSSKPNFDLLPPPEIITSDDKAKEVMTTKVSGLMYDRYNPSAILNINGSDYLVRTGDVINNYKVLSIGREFVTVQYGANVYKAGVGELFTGSGLNYNTISNLESKFGGSKNKANRN